MTPLKFYLYIDKNNKATILPGQLEGLKELSQTSFKLSDGVQRTNSGKGIILGLIDPITEQIIEIKDEHTEDFLITPVMMQKIKDENKIATMPTQQQIRESKYEIPKDLFIDQMVWDFITTSFDIGKYPLLIGPKGSGKTKTAYSVAKAIGANFFPINCGSIFKPKQTLIGSMQAKDGTTFLVNSEFLTHFTSTEKTVIFLNEISRIPAGAANYMMTILDREQNYLYIEEQGKRVYKGADVHFIADANFGFEYTDTRNQDGAFMDRFIKFMVNYLPEKKEIALICQYYPTANVSDVTSLVKRANLCRKNEQIRTAISTRQLLDMTAYMVAGFSFYEVIENIFKNLFVNGSSDERDTIDKMFAAIE
jgi:nitric oxide reductase NorQ protein